MKSHEEIIQELKDKGLIDMTERTEEQQKQFADIKFHIASIQFNMLGLSDDKKYIEANPASHAIAYWVYSELSKLQEQNATLTALVAKLDKEKEGLESHWEVSAKANERLQEENKKLKERSREIHDQFLLMQEQKNKALLANVDILEQYTKLTQTLSKYKEALEGFLEDTELTKHDRLVQKWRKRIETALNENL